MAAFLFLNFCWLSLRPHGSSQVSLFPSILSQCWKRSKLLELNPQVALLCRDSPLPFTVAVNSSRDWQRMMQGSSHYVLMYFSIIPQWHDESPVFSNQRTRGRSWTVSEASLSFYGVGRPVNICVCGWMNDLRCCATLATWYAKSRAELGRIAQHSTIVST